MPVDPPDLLVPVLEEADDDLLLAPEDPALAFSFEAPAFGGDASGEVTMLFKSDTIPIGRSERLSRLSIVSWTMLRVGSGKSKIYNSNASLYYATVNPTCSESNQGESVRVGVNKMTECSSANYDGTRYSNKY